MRAPCMYWDQKEKDEAPPPKTTKTSLGARQKEKERRAAAKDIVLDLSTEDGGIWWQMVHYLASICGSFLGVLA